MAPYLEELRNRLAADTVVRSEARLRFLTELMINADSLESEPERTQVAAVMKVQLSHFRRSDTKGWAFSRTFSNKDGLFLSTTKDKFQIWSKIRARPHIDVSEIIPMALAGDIPWSEVFEPNAVLGEATGVVWATVDESSGQPYDTSSRALPKIPDQSVILCYPGSAVNLVAKPDTRHGAHVLGFFVLNDDPDDPFGRTKSADGRGAPEIVHPSIDLSDSQFMSRLTEVRESN